MENYFGVIGTNIPFCRVFYDVLAALEEKGHLVGPKTAHHGIITQTKGILTPGTSLDPIILYKLKKKQCLPK